MGDNERKNYSKTLPGDNWEMRTDEINWGNQILPHQLNKIILLINMSFFSSLGNKRVDDDMFLVIIDIRKILKETKRWQKEDKGYVIHFIWNI